jgi:hypothetical protein
MTFSNVLLAGPAPLEGRRRSNVRVAASRGSDPGDSVRLKQHAPAEGLTVMTWSRPCARVRETPRKCARRYDLPPALAQI